MRTIYTRIGTLCEYISLFARTREEKKKEKSVMPSARKKPLIKRIGSGSVVVIIMGTKCYYGTTFLFV